MTTAYGSLRTEWQGARQLAENASACAWPV